MQSCTHLAHSGMKCNLAHILCYPGSKPYNLQLSSNLTYTGISLDNSNRSSSPMGVRNIDVQLYNVAHTYLAH